MPLSRAIPTKSSIRTNWDQSNAGTIGFGVNVYWNSSSQFNNGSMFSYIYDTAGYTQIQVNKTGIALISISFGSQGGAWSSLTNMTVLLNEDSDGVVDVLYDLAVPALGSLYPPSSAVIRQVTAGQKYSILVYPAGADLAYEDVNSLSAWAFAEV
jgi:hypothetical protein